MAHSVLHTNIRAMFKGITAKSNTRKPHSHSSTDIDTKRLKVEDSHSDMIGQDILQWTTGAQAGNSAAKLKGEILKSAGNLFPDLPVQVSIDRCIPGPAGLLPKSESMRMPIDKTNYSISFTKKCASKINLYNQAAWITMTSAIQLNGSFPLKVAIGNTIRSVKRLGPKKKVERLIVLIVEITRTDMDAGATFMDLTGELRGTIHSTALKHYELELSVGAVLDLVQVSVFQPTSYSMYLNVTAASINAIYPSDGSKCLQIGNIMSVQNAAAVLNVKQTPSSFVPRKLEVPVADAVEDYSHLMDGLLPEDFDDF